MVDIGPLGDAIGLALMHGQVALLAAKLTEIGVSWQCDD